MFGSIKTQKFRIKRILSSAKEDTPKGDLYLILRRSFHAFRQILHNLNEGLVNEPVAINPYNTHFTKAKKHNLCQHLIFVRLYVVVLIKSTERHFKESNTCLRHIFTQLPGSEEIHSLTKYSICHLDTGSQNLSSNKINR